MKKRIQAYVKKKKKNCNTSNTCVDRRKLRNTRNRGEKQIDTEKGEEW